MRAALEGTPEERRAALQAFLGDDRLRALPDAKRVFRVEGLLRVRLQAQPARKPRGLRAGRIGGSGGHRPPPSQRVTVPCDLIAA